MIFFDGDDDTELSKLFNRKLNFMMIYLFNYMFKLIFCK